MLSGASRNQKWACTRCGPAVSPNNRHISVVEALLGRAVNGLRLLLQPRQLPLEVLDQQVSEIVADALADDHPERGEVGAVLGERVGRHLPAPFTQSARHV